MHRKILYGGDYNPNQWPREVWKTDMRYLKEAGIDCATINVFSWAKIQPEEERYDFSELDDIVAMLNREGIGIVLANNFLMIFIFWEMVGLSSYLLIGFWMTKGSAADAAKLRAGSTHWLRHTFATTALKEMDINIVQNAMGHASIGTTSRYLTPEEAQIAKAMKKMAPL